MLHYIDCTLDCTLAHKPFQRYAPTLTYGKYVSLYSAFLSTQVLLNI